MRTLFLFLIVFNISARSQNREDASGKGNFILITELFPSFKSHSEIEIRTLSKKQIKITVYDSIISKDSLILDDSDIDYFKSALKGISLKTFKTQEGGGSDGITTQSTYYQDSEINKFYIWSPKKSTTDCKILQAILGLARKKFLEKKYQVYFESLKNYYCY